MPTSTSIFKEETINYISKNINKQTNILDVGAGIGRYSDLLKPLGYANIDAIEVFQPYIDSYELTKKYRNVFCENIINTQLSLQNYNLIILGDVVEHMTYRDSLIVLSKFRFVKDIIIAIPFNASQDAVGGNIYEIHIQNDLTNKKFLSIYSDFELYCLRYDYGIYLKKNENSLNSPIYTLDLTDDDRDFLKINYSHKEIINLNKKNNE